MDLMSSKKLKDIQKDVPIPVGIVDERPIHPARKLSEEESVQIIADFEQISLEKARKRLSEIRREIQKDMKR
ncbi:hypothetical protein [Lacticaseibacillus rhamnosus]|uniref:hypothetical protein n=1 Tax=Lacticaseibacillus rhamnosus TaxID=47715 RepID=UPI001BA77D5A|nr:hypothetical protein KAW33_03845 [Lacticaseibacillus rhamnosus]QUS96641.1 hypothetical protein KFU59_03855 [Lacticaseibacillus rhamnosus]